MKAGLTAAVAALLVVIVVLASAAFTVGQTQQALVLRFGEPQSLITEPGLHWKQPFVETVVYLDNRILDLETPQEEVLASDSQRLLVDAFVRYHIADPLKFYQTVGTIQRANNQLGSVLNSALRRVLGDATLPQIIKDNRAALMVQIRDEVNTEAARLGAAVNDVPHPARRPAEGDLGKGCSAACNRSARARRAQYRAQGAEQAQTITATADRDVVVIKADAQRQADQTRGARAMPTATASSAEAFGKDPDFFAFYRSMQAYAASLKPGDTRFVVSPTSSFFRYFDNPAGTAPAATAAPQP